MDTEFEVLSELYVEGTSVEAEVADELDDVVVASLELKDEDELLVLGTFEVDVVSLDSGLNSTVVVIGSSL